MDKVKNFRDLGGIPTADGKRIKKGLFFRSAFLDDATDEDIEFLRALNLKKIFDYRDVAEVNRNNDIKYKKIGAKHMHYPNNITRGRVYKLQGGGIERAFIKIKPEDVCEFYSLLPVKNVGYQSMAEALKRGDVPFLQHCTAGKDRAGLGSAILLGILGVSYDEIVKDYLISLEIRNYIKGKMMNQIPAPVRAFLKNKYEPLFIVDKSYIDAAYDAIKKEYGSFENFVRDDLKLSDEDVEAIRAKYTE